MAGSIGGRPGFANIAAVDPARPELRAERMARQPPPPKPAAKPVFPRKTLRRAGFLLRYGTITVIWTAVVLFFTALWFTWDLPDPGRAVTEGRRPAILLLDPAGHLVGRFGDVAGNVLLPDQLPPYAPAAFIAIEDRRFAQHGPFDAQGVARAALLDVLRRHVVQGGSTLTQQVAKPCSCPISAPSGARCRRPSSACGCGSITAARKSSASI